MEVSSRNVISILLTLLVCTTEIHAITMTCTNRKSPCFLRKLTCPPECPTTTPNTKGKVCFLDCQSPICKPECRRRKPNCHSPGAACFDPRFVGADGVVFYFHGKSNEHFSLLSDLNLQVNARFIGHRPDGRTRDFTWIQALGILFDSQTLSLEAAKAAAWSDEVDLLKFTHNGKELIIPEGHLSSWQSPDNGIRVERTSNKNSVVVVLPESMDISVNVVPVTREDDRIHKYKIPSDDCFAHLEVQFRFFGLSSKVEGVLGRTYRPDYQNPVKLGVAMPVVGGEDLYRTTSLLSTDCRRCAFSPTGVLELKGLVGDGIWRA